MFVRINKSGERRYLQVVESYRNEDGKPRHRVVANLGRVDGMEEGHLDALIRGLCRVTVFYQLLSQFLIFHFPGDSHSAAIIFH